MFFSVILPIYNVEKYLNECVESILAQTFKDYEIILVDDGSKDKSGVICDAYAEQYDFIKVIHKENGGSSDARNKGIEAAKGEYIVYIDGDDYVIRFDFLESIYKKIDEENTDIVLYKFAKFFDDEKIFEPCTFSLPCIGNKSDPDALLLELVKKDAYYGMAWVKAFRRSIVIENGIFFEKGLLGEDMDWYFELLLHAEKISVINEVYIAYRQRRNSVTSSYKIKNLTDFIYILKKWYKRIEAEPLSETKRTALQGALAKYYSNLLVMYMRLKDRKKKEYRGEVKSLAFLLEYGLSRRPIQIRRAYKLFGFTGVMAMLRIYDKIK